MAINCRLCGQSVFEIGGYLHRVNEKGGTGIWECRPSCDAQLTSEEALLLAIEPNAEEEEEEEELHGKVKP